MSLIRHLSIALTSLAVAALGMMSPASASTPRLVNVNTITPTATMTPKVFHPTKVIPATTENVPMASLIGRLSHTQWQAIAAWLAGNTVELEPKPRITYDVQFFGPMIRVNALGMERCDVNVKRLCVEGRPVLARLEITAVDTYQASTLYFEAEDDALILMAFWLEGVGKDTGMDTIGVRSDSERNWQLGARSTVLHSVGPHEGHEMPTKDLDAFVASYRASTIDRILDTLQTADVHPMATASMTRVMTAAVASIDEGVKKASLLPTFRGDHAKVATRFIDIMVAAHSPQSSFKQIAQGDIRRVSLQPVIHAGLIGGAMTGSDVAASGPAASVNPGSFSGSAHTGLIQPAVNPGTEPGAKSDAVETSLTRWYSAIEAYRAPRAEAFDYFVFNDAELSEVFGF